MKKIITSAARGLAAVNGQDSPDGARHVIESAIKKPADDLILPPDVKRAHELRKRKNEFELKFQFVKKRREPGYHIAEVSKIRSFGSDYFGTTLCGRTLVFNQRKGAGTTGKYCPTCYKILQKLDERLSESFAQ